MKVTCEINDYSTPAMEEIKIHNAWADENCVVIEADGKRYTVNADELISAVQKCKLKYLER